MPPEREFPFIYAMHNTTSLLFYNITLLLSQDPGQEPFSFTIGLGQVIKGWDEGVLTMKLGEVSRITCTPDYAYGSGGFPSWGILPDSTLVFEIEVLSC